MIQDKNSAEIINKVVLDVSSKLNRSLTDVQGNISEEEFDSYRETISKVLTLFLIEIMNPLYQIHPALKPKELK